MHITIIAYKPDSSDYCRGCLMDSWGSDFRMSVASSIEKAVKDVVETMMIPIEEREAGYEFTAIINGHTFTSIHESSYSKSYSASYECDEYNDDMSDAVQDADEILKKIFNTAFEEVKQQKIVKAETDRLAKLAEQQRQNKIKREQDLQLLAKLQAQYGN